VLKALTGGKIQNSGLGGSYANHLLDIYTERIENK
jgi:hypothetical protein